MRRPQCQSKAGISPGSTGRATEERPSWAYQRLLSGKLAAASAALDIQTGGGEVLAGAGAENFPPTMVATEGWPPNVAKATALLHPLGAVVVADPDDPPLPFADDAFDLVTSRHPASVYWSEIARVLAPGGTYFAQHVGSSTNVEISEFFLGPLEPSDSRHHEVETKHAEAVGLEVDQCRNERLRLEFFDVGAMVFFLRKVIWTVPDFTVDRYRSRLRDMHDQIERDGAFPLHDVSDPLPAPQADPSLAHDLTRRRSLAQLRGHERRRARRHHLVELYARLQVVAIRRPCSKVLLVDERFRVLLFSGIDRTKPDVPPWWFPVGGGLEDGETPEDAAIRETREETGLIISDPGPIVFTRRFTWDFEGEGYDQEEWYFLVHTSTFEPSSSEWTNTESATIRGHRWWSIDELRATAEAVFPENLPDQLERLLGG